VNTRPLPSWHPLAECVQDMTLRDYFAAKALQGIMVDPNVTMGADKIAEWAYMQADAMLEVRDAAQ
jgi:hypothetical protein